MHKVTYTQARQHLSALLDTVIDDSETVYITRKNGKEIAMVDAREYESLKETAYLLSSKANVDHLLSSIQQAEKKEGREIDLQDYLDS